MENVDEKYLYHFAAKYCLLSILKEASEYELNQRDGYGRLPIHYAALKGHLDALKLIVTHGYFTL